MRLLLPLALAAATAYPQVHVEIFENVPAGNELTPAGDTSTFRYTEPAFGFVHLPAKYSKSAIAVDRSTPFVLRASYERSIPSGAYRIRLRARGAATLAIDGKEVARTKTQLPNKNGDDPVPPPPVIDESGHRPPQHPHQDIMVDFQGDGQPHTFVLTAVIGGKGLMPTPGELAVAWGKAGDLQRLLGPDNAPRLIDSEWERFADIQYDRHAAADRERRAALSKDIVARWRERHQSVRAYYQDRAIAVPAAAAGYPAYNAVDHFLNARLTEAGVRTRPLTSDLEFLRRLSLDTRGVIPAVDEIKAFLEAPAATRRAQAIERLLSDQGWADNWVSYWQDVLAENPGILKPDLNNTGPFRWWIHQSFADGVSFDRFVAELVQMDGSLYQGAPAAFAQATLNDAPMAAKADIVAQAFLGQKLGCARCHDAPFHPFKQQDLFGLAAMLKGEALKLPATSTVPVVEGRRKPAVNITLKPGQTIDPAWPFANLVSHSESGGAVPVEGKIDSRRELAALLIAPENERFAEVIVNRVWKRYMGAGFVEPVDDWSRSKASHPELLKWLARDFAMSGYDLKHLARTIFESHAYQRKAIEELADTQMSAAKRLFAGPLRRKMSAEQLVDSLHLSVGKQFECEELNLNTAGDRPPAQFLNMGKPRRAWQLTALSNERDRPALALPIAQSLVDVMTAYGWRQSRQSAQTVRDDASSPMQTLILANGILGTRLVRLSDDSVFTELALKDMPLEQFIGETFLRVLSRPPDADEIKTFAGMLAPVYASRKVEGAEARYTAAKSDSRVSWSNHLSAEATRIRMQEEVKLRMGAEPTKRLKSDFRERFEDTLWAMVNSPEFVLMP